MKIRQSYKALTDLARVVRLERTTSSSQSWRATNCAIPGSNILLLVYQNAAPRVKRNKGAFKAFGLFREM